MKNKLLEKALYNSCSHPLKRKIYDVTTNEFKIVECACGKCLHCRMTKQNEWVTRMTLQSMTWQYFYFVTLTYSENAPKFILEETNACESYLNTFGRKEELSPLTLNKTHLQKFWKRLRKRTGNKPISYFECGEYGSTYNRPHYHILMWSDFAITKEDIEEAWKLNDVVIGSVDFHDERVELSQSKEKQNPYGYVTKYVTKNYEFDFLKCLRKYDHINLINNIELEDEDKKENETEFSAKVRKYTKLYKPFSLCSKKYAIGGRYLQENIERFSSGDFRLLGIHDKSLIFPSYFYRKTKDYICPFRSISAPLLKDARIKSTPNILSVIQAFCAGVSDFECLSKGIYNDDLSPLRNLSKMDVAYQKMSLFNLETKEYFIPDVKNGNYNIYKYNRKERLWKMSSIKTLSSMYDVLLRIWEKLLNFLSNIETQSKVRKSMKNDLIYKEYIKDAYDSYPMPIDDVGRLNYEYDIKKICYDMFLEDIQQYESIYNKNHERKQEIYKLTKNKF